MTKQRRTDIENGILSTFLFANELEPNLDFVFELDTSIFTSPFRKRVAEKINAVDDGAYGFLQVQIEESVDGTEFHQDYCDMIAQNSLTLVKKYHDDLVEINRLGALA